MALPLDNRQINNIVSTTLDAKRKETTDLFFKSNVFFVRMYQKGKIKVKGGEQITVPIVYDKLPGGSYGRGDTFGTAIPEFLTEIRLQWKRNRAEMAMDGLDQKKNQGAAKLIDLTSVMIDNARLSLADRVGTQLFGDGTGNGGKDIDGLKIAVSDTGTYGGITRESDLQGTAIKATINTTGGPFSKTMVQTSFGDATRGAAHPDLILSDQTIYNKMWERTEPQQRHASDDLAKVGFKNGFQFNGADWQVDSHVPSGTIYLLNTDYIEFHVLEGGDFVRRGPFDLPTQDAWVDQLLLYANLVVTAPWSCSRIDNVT